MFIGAYSIRDRRKCVISFLKGNIFWRRKPLNHIFFFDRFIAINGKLTLSREPTGVVKTLETRHHSYFSSKNIPTIIKSQNLSDFRYILNLYSAQPIEGW